MRTWATSSRGGRDVAAAGDRTGRGPRAVWRRLLGARAGRARDAALELEQRGRVLAALQRVVDEVAARTATGPARCMVRIRDVECPDPAGVRIVTRCRTLVDAVTPCSAPVYACPAHRGTAATAVALKAVCERHGARVDVIGVEVL